MCHPPWTNALHHGVLRFWPPTVRPLDETSRRETSSWGIAVPSTLSAPFQKPSTRNRLTLVQKADAMPYFLSGAMVPQVTRFFKCFVCTAKYVKAKAQENIDRTEESPIAIQHRSLRFLKYPDIGVRLLEFSGCTHRPTSYHAKETGSTGFFYTQQTVTCRERGPYHNQKPCFWSFEQLDNFVCQSTCTNVYKTPRKDRGCMSFESCDRRWRTPS